MQKVAILIWSMAKKQQIHPLKKNLSWKMMLILFVVCEVSAYFATLTFSYMSYPFHEIGRSLAAAFQIGGLLLLVLGIIGMIKALFRK